MSVSRPALSALACAACLLIPLAAKADKPTLVSPDQGWWRVNGYIEAQIRTLSDDYDPDLFYLSQSAFVLDIEPELDILTESWGPFDHISAFARIEVRYDCVFNGCGTIGSSRMFGDNAKVSPARNWANARTATEAGAIEINDGKSEYVQNSDLDLLGIVSAPGNEVFFDLGIKPSTVEAAFGPRADDLFTWKEVDGPGGSLAVPLGPWPYSDKIEPNGALGNIPSNVLPLPMRPAMDSLNSPSARLRHEQGKFDSFDQNFSEDDLAWNHGASQDEYELKEVYLDIEMFDSRLWIRAGKQNIVWGKTELFRTTDQFNPIDIGLASLPSLEESRVGLWALRGVYSFYDVGPLSDVRLELAVNLDDFEPIDTGRCGEPYTVWLICFKSTGLWIHGTTAFGIAGEEKPPDPWEDIDGLEGGVRLEFRWERFTFALTDYYGYDDVPTIELFNEYSRNVDPKTGRPLDSRGELLTPDNAGPYASGNRQAFDLGCASTQGFGGKALEVLTAGFATELPDISERCINDLLNVQDSIVIDFFGVAEFDTTVAEVIGMIVAGQQLSSTLINTAQANLEIPLDQRFRITPLNRDSGDGPPGDSVFGSRAPNAALSTENMSYYLSDQQEALLGCGPFYETDCDNDGIDFFNAEASVLLQAFPGFEKNPVGTRFFKGRQVILPGARGPGDKGYKEPIDGTPPPGFDSEMQALSANVAATLAILGIAEGDKNCNLKKLETCLAIQAIESITGSRRPERRAGGNGSFGRRDFLWQGGGEAVIRYEKRNVLGLSVDFAEDFLISNWAFEFTWVNDQSFASNTSSDLTQNADVYNLTVSVDRPTFINFLNANRTFFLNSQWFFNWIPEHNSSFDVNGPVGALATFTVATGYYQDRLLPALTWVHDIQSESGGLIGQLSYRYTEAMSVTVGFLSFYGRPSNNRVPFHPISLPNTQTDFNSKIRYGGLSAIAERDELFLRLRYTF